MFPKMRCSSAKDFARISFLPRTRRRPNGVACGLQRLPKQDAKAIHVLYVVAKVEDVLVSQPILFLGLKVQWKVGYVGTSSHQRFQRTIPVYAREQQA